MWQIEKDAEYEKRRKKWPRKYRRELVAMLENLDTLHKALSDEGVRPEQAKRCFSFVHSEPLGLFAIDQRGGGGGLKQSRLYVYPDEGEQVLYLLTLGGKESQGTDIKFCKAWIEEHAQG